MLRVIFTLITITLWFPILLLVTRIHFPALMVYYGITTFLIGLLILIPLVCCYIQLKWVRLWQFMVVSSIVGVGWACALSRSKIEFQLLTVIAATCCAHAIIFWLVAFWRNAAFSSYPNAKEQDSIKSDHNQ